MLGLPSLTCCSRATLPLQFRLSPACGGPLGSPLPHLRSARDTSTTAPVLESLGSLLRQAARSMAQLASGSPAAAPVASERWWSADTVAVVTGANKGIGREIARLLAEQGLKVVLTARSTSAGEEAVAVLRAAGHDGVVFRPLDIASQQSVEEFAGWARANLPGGITILINNAGLAYKGNVFGAEEAKRTLDVNFRGTANVCEALAPLLTEGGARVVNVCSGAGKLRIVPDAALRERFQNAQSREEVERLADEFVDAIKRGRHAQEGWPSSMYGVSKLCEATYTRILAQQLEGRHTMVNAICPGYCATDMSSWKGLKTAAEGADTPIWLALLPPDAFVTGRFFSDRKEEPF